MKTGSQTTSAQSTGKNKKLLHEYASFDKKVGYFLLSSTYKGKHFAKAEIDPVYSKCPDTEIDQNRQRFEQGRASAQPPNLKALARWNEYLQPFYTLYRQFNMGLEMDKPKRNILIRIKEMFDSPLFDSSILVYSGPMTARGGLLIESQSFSTEELVFKDVLAEWVNRTSKQAHLLIILDCNYAGKWIDDLLSLPEKVDSVSVLASCDGSQKAAYFEMGMWFTYNVMKFLYKNQTEQVVVLPQTPRFAGDYLACKRNTNLYLNFNSWPQLSAIQKSDFAMIEYDNGTYIGHILSGQKHFWGSFVWKQGVFKDCRYEGEFVKGKLEGRGVMAYNNGRFYVGEFKANAPDGMAFEQYENGDKYVGHFSKGLKSGHGVYTYSNGEVYEGKFEANRPSGHGRLTISKTSFYEGQFKNGKCNGQGKYKYANGDVYEGQWQESIKHGRGVYRYACGDVYEGEFVNGLRHGRGKLTLSSGEVYDGGWENDHKSGEGKYTTADGEIVGCWANGKMVNQTTFFSKIGTQKIQTGI